MSQQLAIVPKRLIASEHSKVTEPISKSIDKIEAAVTGMTESCKVINRALDDIANKPTDDRTAGILERALSGGVSRTSLFLSKAHKRI